MIVRWAFRLFFSLLMLVNARTLYLFLKSQDQGMLLATAAALLALCLATAWRPLVAALAFLSLIPVISGLNVAGILPHAKFVQALFAVLYGTWYVKAGLYRYTPAPSASRTMVLALVFGWLCLASMGLCLLRHPVGLLVDDLCRGHFYDVHDVLYYLDAGTILLQGIAAFFLYTILGATQGCPPAAIRKVLLVQAAGILVFGIAQLWTGNPPQDAGVINVYSPFADKHSYGSYVLLLFFVFLSQARSGRRWHPVPVVLAALFFGLVILSYSRMTFLAMLLVAMVYLWNNMSKKIMVACATACLAFIICGNLYYTMILKTENPLVIRYARAFSFNYIARDCNVISRELFWMRAVNIIKASPLRGVGMGRYYTRSLDYNDPELKNFALANSCAEYADKPENAHNYFLQVAAEIGLPGLLALLGLFCTAPVFQPRRPSGAHAVPGLARGLRYGLAAYIVTWLTSHPLLLPVQQLLFWPLFALSNQFVDAPRSRRPGRFSRIKDGFLAGLAFVRNRVWPPAAEHLPRHQDSRQQPTPAAVSGHRRRNGRKQRGNR